MRRRSSAFTSFSFACNRLRTVCRNTVKHPELLFFPQICVKPRKLNVSGFPSPRRWRSRTANGPNSSRRVFSGCSSRSNFRIRCVSSAQNRLTSAFPWNPTTMSSAKRTNTAALGCTFFHPYPLPVLQHARIQPFLDESHNASVRNSMLDELHQPFVQILSEKLRMSKSSTQLTFLVSSLV